MATDTCFLPTIPLYIIACLVCLDRLEPAVSLGKSAVQWGDVSTYKNIPMELLLTTKLELYTREYY